MEHQRHSGMSTRIRAVLIAMSSSLGRHGVVSGIFKRPLDHTVEVTHTGLRGDEQGDKKTSRRTG